MTALEAITARKYDEGHSAIYDLLDNSTTVEALLTGMTTSSSRRVQKFWKMAARAAASVRVGWIPRHPGLSGTEAAVRLTRIELNSPDNARTIYDRMTLASLGRKARELTRQMLTDWWHSNRPKRYANLELEMKHKKPPELLLARAAYTRLLAARTAHSKRESSFNIPTESTTMKDSRHGNLAAYHHRLNHATAILYCEFGRENSIGQLVRCRRALASEKWKM